MPIEDLDRKVRFFVRLKVDLGKEQKVTEELFNFPEVKEVHETIGEKDLLVVVEWEHDVIATLKPAQTIVRDFITKKLAKVHHIKDTETIVPTRSRIRT